MLAIEKPKAKNINGMNQNHCAKSVRILSCSGPLFPYFIETESGKMRTRITLNTSTFYAVNISPQTEPSQIDCGNTVDTVVT